MRHHGKRPKKRRRSHKQPGTAPGTLKAVEGALPTEIRFTRYSAELLYESDPVGVGELPPPEAGQVLWVNVTGTGDVEAVEALGERLGIHPLALEDVVNVDQRPKLESYGQDLFVVMRMYSKVDGALIHDSEQLCLLLRRGLVMTIQERPGDCFDWVRKRLQTVGRRVRQRGSDYLAYALIDAVIDGYQPVLDDFEIRLEAIEDRLLGAPTDQDLKILHGLRRDLISLRREVAPMRDVVQVMIRDPETVETMSDETRLFLRDCYDHVLRTVDQIDTFRELCASLMDLYLSTVSNRTNDVMKVLTMIATVFIPLSFLVGLYGMNFDTSSPWNMPELSSPFGYPILVTVMLLVAGALIFYFKKKDWL